MRISGYWNSMDLSTAENGILIHSCGHNYLTNTDGINRPHGRENYLLLYMHKEYELFLFGQERTPQKAPAGSVVLYRPGDRQCHYYDGGRTAENYYVHFSLTDAALLESLPIVPCCIHDLEPSRQVVEHFETIIRELQRKAPHYRKVATARLIELLCSVCRKIEGKHHAGQTTAIKSVSQIINLIHEQYFLETTLDDYAQACNLSKYHFSHLFKQATGTSPIAYRNQIRIQHAQELLEESDMPIADVAAAVGYPANTSSSIAAKQKPRKQCTKPRKTDIDEKPPVVGKHLRQGANCDKAVRTKSRTGYHPGRDTPCIQKNSIAEHAKFTEKPSQ